MLVSACSGSSSLGEFRIRDLLTQEKNDPRICVGQAEWACRNQPDTKMANPLHNPTSTPPRHFIQNPAQTSDSLVSWTGIGSFHPDALSGPLQGVRRWIPRMQFGWAIPTLPRRPWLDEITNNAVI
jgi:hypothetical protein